MCCQEGNATLRHTALESAGWWARLKAAFPGQAWTSEELVTEAAELIITLVPVQDGVAGEGHVARSCTEAEAAELIITLRPGRGSREQLHTPWPARDSCLMA